MRRMFIFWICIFCAMPDATYSYITAASSDEISTSFYRLLLLMKIRFYTLLDDEDKPTRIKYFFLQNNFLFFIFGGCFYWTARFFNKNPGEKSRKSAIVDAIALVPFQQLHCCIMCCSDKGRQKNFLYHYVAIRQQLQCSQTRFLHHDIQDVRWILYFISQSRFAILCIFET